MNSIIFQTILILISLRWANLQEIKTNKSTQGKRSVILGDLSYSYAATDIESNKGSHIKTITVIKNVAAPKSHHSPTSSGHDHKKDWTKHVKNQFKFFVKVPEIPDISTLDIFTNKSKAPKDQHNNDNEPTTNSEPKKNENPVQNDSKIEPQFQKDPTPDIVPVYEPQDNDSPIGQLPEAMSLTNDKDRTDNVSKDVELLQLEPVVKQECRQSGVRQSAYIEDFSDYSMHNVKHLDKPTRSKNLDEQPRQAYESQQLRHQSKIHGTAQDNGSKKQQYQNYGTKMEKSQSYIDISQQAVSTVKPKPYLAPSVKQAFITSTQRSINNSPTKQTNNQFASTSQKPYINPFSNKPNYSQQPVSYNLQRTSDTSYSLTNPQSPSTLYTGYKIGSNPKNGAFKENVGELKANADVYSSRGSKSSSTEKYQSFVAAPKKSTTSLEHKSENSFSRSNKGLHTQHQLSSRLQRYPYVFNKKPPHDFFETPFK